MKKLTLGLAAKEAGVSKTTLWRAIQKGKMSATLDDDGQYKIDPSELFRCYPIETGTVPVKQTETHQEQMVNNEIVALKRVISTQETLIETQNETLKDLRTRLDDSEKERRESARTLQLLLTHQEGSTKGFKGWWFILLALMVLVAWTGVIYWLKWNG